MGAVRHKRGDIREDGMVFLRYKKGGGVGEMWTTPEKFVEKSKIRREWLRIYHSDEDNAEKVRAQKAAHYASNRDVVLEKCARYRAANRENVRATKAAYYEANREAVNKKTAAYNKTNRKAISAAQKERYKNDPLFALACRMRISVCNTLRRGGYTKKSKTAKIIGCSFEELKAHLESLFLDGMGWENRHLWHIDHIIPLASAKSEDEILSLNHYSNLQPLWAYDNMSKGCKMPE